MARATLTSPLATSMPYQRSVYSPSSAGRRNSYGNTSTYSTSYNTSYNTSYRSHVNTGAAVGSYNSASKKFGTSYTSPSSKPPIYQARSRVVSPTSRPLPKGPGPLDQYGNKISVNETISSFRTRANTPTRTNITPRRPLKADHTSSYYNSNSLDRYTPTSPRYSPSSYTDTPRLSRTKRTNSISDLTNGLDDVHLGSTSSSFRSSKKFGSTADINGNTDRYENLDELSSPKHTPTKTYTQTSYLKHSDTESSLPDISDRPNSASRSPSIDRSRRDKKGNTTLNNNVSSYNGSRHSSPEHTGKGLVGLRNLGNTCFMNSIIQCLSNTHHLRNFCLNEEYVSEINTETSGMKGALVKSFAKLMKSMWSKAPDSSVSPNEFKEKISKFAPRFIGYNQQDAQEFLIYLLEGLHEDLNRCKRKKKRIMDCDDGVVTTPAKELAENAWRNYQDVDDSHIVDLFVGQLRSALTCTVCGYVSNTFDIFMDLSLPIKKGRYSSSVSLSDCLDLFTQEEVLEGDERPTCAKCKKRQKCTKRFSIQRFPEVLIIHLKRFNQDSYYRSKLSTMVDFPPTALDLSPYSAESSNRSGRSTKYNLYAVSNHSGTPFGGHYTAYAKNEFSAQWHHYNDQRVSSISQTRVVSSEGYVLFYQRAKSS